MMKLVISKDKTTVQIVKITILLIIAREIIGEKPSLCIFS